MRRWISTLALSALLAPVAAAGEAGDLLAQRLYDGTAREARQDYAEQCGAGAADACFGLGLIELIGTVEGLSQALYRHGAVLPDTPAAAMLLGLGTDVPRGPANPDPEPLTYEGLRAILEDFVAGLDAARQHFEAGGAPDDYVLLIDPLRVRFDIDGDGTVGAAETLGALLRPALDLAQPFEPEGKAKSKGAEPAAPDTTIGFDRADSLWFAGYTQVTAAPLDLLLAHDFSEFYDAWLHRVFPRAGLPMQEHSTGRGTAFLDPDSDGFIADVIAAFHTADFPVTDSDRLAGVLTRLGAVTALSRRNWEAILAETDDNRELVPSPAQTSLVPEQAVSQEVVDAWLATLDAVDRVLAGELLLPHWRFSRGFDLKAYFETATETDVVMLLTGLGALPFLADGPVADARSFAELNRVMGDDWPLFAIWFN